MKILLTGATGYLGSYLIPAFLGEGHEVIILKRSFSNTKRIDVYLNKVQFYDVDLVPFQRPFEEHGGFDCVVHTATNYGRSGETASEISEANLLFPLKILEVAACHNIATFINTSTILYKYSNYYALSKWQFEKWGKLFADQGKIQFVNLKLDHMYGPGDDSSKFTTWIVQSFMKNVDSIKITPGKQKRDFIYIDDVVTAFSLMLKNIIRLGLGFQQIGLGSGKAVSVREFVETVKILIGADTKINFGAKPYRRHETMYSEADISKLESIGWAPKNSLIVGLRKMIKGEVGK